MLNTDQFFELLDDRRSIPCGDPACTDRLIPLTTTEAKDMREFMMWVLDEASMNDPRIAPPTGEDSRGDVPG